MAGSLLVRAVRVAVEEADGEDTQFAVQAATLDAEGEAVVAKTPRFDGVAGEDEIVGETDAVLELDNIELSGEIRVGVEEWEAASNTTRVVGDCWIKAETLGEWSDGEPHKARFGLLSRGVECGTIEFVAVFEAYGAAGGKPSEAKEEAPKAEAEAEAEASHDQYASDFEDHDETADETTLAETTAETATDDEEESDEEEGEEEDDEEEDDEEDDDDDEEEEEEEESGPKPITKSQYFCEQEFWDHTHTDTEAWIADAIERDPRLKRMHGRWTTQDKQTCTYLGTTLDGVKHGWGAIRWGTGDRYEGEWKMEQMHGFGKFVWAATHESVGATYSGQWTDGMMDGKGRYTVTDGTVYEGTWQMDVMVGEDVRVRFPDGGEYTGPIVDDKIEGEFGRIDWPDGNSYQGTLVNNERHGQGTYTWGEQQRRYIGSWENNVPHGNGSMVWNKQIATGWRQNKYDGEWKHGKRHGRGVYIWADGTQFRGQWMDGKRVKKSGTLIGPEEKALPLTGKKKLPARAKKGGSGKAKKK